MFNLELIHQALSVPLRFRHQSAPLNFILSMPTPLFFFASQIWIHYRPTTTTSKMLLLPLSTSSLLYDASIIPSYYEINISTPSSRIL